MDQAALVNSLIILALTQIGLLVWWGSRLTEIVKRNDTEINGERGLRHYKHEHANQITALNGQVEDHEQQINDLRDDFRGLIGIKEVRP